jgi:hypothetical protein
MTPLDFLNLLWQFKPAESYVLIWTLPDKCSHWFRDVTEAAAFALAACGQDVYVGVGLSNADRGLTHRCVSDEVAGLIGFWADFDIRSEAHTKALPATIEDALSIIPECMPPTLVIATGNGAHAWWLLKEPHVFDDAEDRKDTAMLVSRWQTLLRLRASQRGWAFDRLSDLARVLRIPGTVNFKDPNNPKAVTLHSETERRYNLSDFEDYLDDAAIPDPEAEEKATREWAQRFADKPLVIDVSARIPQGMLDGWMAADLRFRNTWNRQRHDLKDQSQSGYDMALAAFGAQAGLAEQQIVDLIVHHRSLYARSQRTRLDYFQRTITKAFRPSLGPDAPMVLLGAPLAATTGTVAPPDAPVALGAGGPTDAASFDPIATRALLCERISALLGVRICRLVKFAGKEPTYHMELEEGKSEFLSVRKLMSQSAVREEIAAATGKIIRKFKGKDWDQLAQAMLDACVIEQGGEENEWEGSARMYVAQYLDEIGFIESIEGQLFQNQRRPVVLDGKVLICASDLQMYINRSMGQMQSVKAVASMLGALSAKSIRVRGSKFKEQGRWVLPLDQFDPAEYPRGKREEHASHAM